MSCRIFFSVLLLVVVASHVIAQTPDSRGTEFRVTFMPIGGASSYPELRLFASGQVPTQVRVTWMETGQTETFDISQSNGTAVIDINAVFGDSLELPDATGTGITRRSFHITSDAEITLSGVNASLRSADAFLCLPQDVLTQRVLVLAYTTGYGFEFYDMPSQFAVIATRNNTILSVIPPYGTGINGRFERSYSIRLDSGEVWLAQTPLDQSYDLSGTLVTATAPIAVFGGSKRSSIPTRLGNHRDHMVEQMPPMEIWGREAMVTPFPTLIPGGDTARFRILAMLDSTFVTVSGGGGSQQEHMLAAGGVLELPLLEAYSVRGSRPILVAEYERSASNSPSLEDTLGDPFMILATSTEQYDTAYSFYSIDMPDFGSRAHYITVVATANEWQTVRLDGAPVTGFLPVPFSHYVYAIINVAPGSHHIRGDTPFGLMVYGYGATTSYGYPGGMLCRRLVADSVLPFLAEVDGLRSGTRGESGFVVHGPTSDLLRLTVDELPGERIVVELVPLNGVGSELGTVDAGTRSIALPLGATPSGFYLCRLRSVSGRLLGTRPIVVVR